MKRLVFVAIALAVGAAAWFWFSRRTSQPEGLPRSVAEFKQMPGGAPTVDAAEYVISRAKAGSLPGFSSDDHGSMVAPNIKPPQESTEAFPILRVVCLHKNGDTAEYYYWVLRDSNAAPWRLTKAWRASPAGQTLEQYSVE